MQMSREKGRNKQYPGRGEIHLMTPYAELYQAKNSRNVSYDSDSDNKRDDCLNNNSDRRVCSVKKEARVILKPTYLPE